MKKLPHPSADQIELPIVLAALADPTRLQIVARLAQVGELTCGAVDHLIPKSNLSYHLRLLREAGVTTTRVEGVRRHVSLRRADLDRRFPGLLDAVLTAAPNTELFGGEAA